MLPVHRLHVVWHFDPSYTRPLPSLSPCLPHDQAECHNLEDQQKTARGTSGARRSNMDGSRISSTSANFLSVLTPSLTLICDWTTHGARRVHGNQHESLCAAATATVEEAQAPAWLQRAWSTRHTLEEICWWGVLSDIDFVLSLARIVRWGWPCQRWSHCKLPPAAP